MYLSTYNVPIVNYFVIAKKFRGLGLYR